MKQHLSEQTTGRMKIIKIPHGDAPEEIRAQWVGLTLQCYPTFSRLHECFTKTGELNAKAHDELNPWGVWVPSESAMDVLESKRREAFHYFHLVERLPKQGVNFFFRRDEVEVLHESVTWPQITLVPEEAMGHQPYR